MPGRPMQTGKLEGAFSQGFVSRVGDGTRTGDILIHSQGGEQGKRRKYNLSSNLRIPHRTHFTAVWQGFQPVFHVFPRFTLPTLPEQVAG